MTELERVYEACEFCGFFHPDDFDCRACAMGSVRIGGKIWYEYFGFESAITGVTTGTVKINFLPSPPHAR